MEHHEGVHRERPAEPPAPHTRLRGVVHQCSLAHVRISFIYIPNDGKVHAKNAEHAEHVAHAQAALA